MSSVEDNVQNNTQCTITKKIISLMTVPIIDIDIKAIDDIYKKWKKDKKEEKADAVKNKKSENKNKPKKNNKKLDENGEVKVVQLSKYQIFVKEIQPYINETYPGIANNERMIKVGDEWKKHKAKNADLEEKPEIVEKKEEKPEIVEKKEAKKVVDKKDKEENFEITEEKTEIVEKKEAKKKLKK